MFRARVAGFALASFIPGGAGLLVPPVDGPVIRSFDAPPRDYGSGHRGVDFAAEPGTLVRAAAHGTVTFAGQVAGSGAVTVDHGNGMRTTYSRLDEIHVAAGARVDQGTWLGTVRDAHDRQAGLHLGVIVDDQYADPETYLGPLDVSSAIHLAPVVWTPPEVLPDTFASAFEHAGTHARNCEPIVASGTWHAPNDNIAVAVAGIASRTHPRVDAEIYEHGPEQLGYAEGDIYRFSYRGHEGTRFHEPYQSQDTFGDIRRAAGKLRALLAHIARRHPGRGVDLIAHSQGGIVARTFLQEAARAWDPGLPRVEHIVTFASPHEGAPLAAAAGDLVRQPGLVGTATRLAGRWAARRGILPEPGAPSVQQLTPGSDLLGALAKGDVLFGVRALALGIPNDPIVPATSARWRHQTSITVPPAGGLVGGHKTIVKSETALAVAYRFLRDGPPICPSRWDHLGWLTGKAISGAEQLVPRMIDVVVP